MTGEPNAKAPEYDLPAASAPGALRTEPSPGAISESATTAASPMSGSSYSDEYSSRFVDATHSYLREQIRNADQKAIFFFGAATAVLAFMHSIGASSRWLKSLHSWTFLDTSTFVGMSALAVAALAAIATVVPRLPGSKRGFLYFNAIAEYESAAEYARDVLGTSGPVLQTEKAKHCHVLSRICRTKYRLLRFSVWAALVGLVGASAYFLFAPPSSQAAASAPLDGGDRANR
jgi:hypothetical protein